MGQLRVRSALDVLSRPRDALVEFQLGRVAAFEQLLDPYKKRLLEGVGGTVVEIGPGLGTNFRYLESGSRWIGIEPDAELHEYLRTEALQFKLQPTLIESRAEEIPLEDGSADAVIGSLVLCSVDDPEAALHEVRRILKPGGRYYFVEHIAAPRGSWRRLAQKAVRPVWYLASDGCRLDRPTDRLLESARFTRVQLERATLGRLITDPHIIGSALK